MRGRQRVLDWLAEEWRGWPDPTLEVFAPPAEPQAGAVQFRIYATEDGAYVEHNRALFLAWKDGAVRGIDLYCAEPLFSAHRKDYVAPATLSDDAVRTYLEELWHGWDVREWMPPDRRRDDSRRIFRAGSGDKHPASNFVGGSRWTAGEADAQIEKILAEHAREGTGFEWWVMPSDTPADLPERLERHGLLLAGENVRMARLGLDDLSDIAVNPDIVLQDLDGPDRAGIEAILEIEANAFHLPAVEIEHERKSMLERLADPQARQKSLYSLAYLDGRAVGMAAADFRFGRMYLSGAATLPEYRGRRIYSTLLKHRLAAARDRGFHLAAIDAGPMSKRVVAKYGFKEYGTVKVYGWMPQMDPAVIKTLVPDE